MSEVRIVEHSSPIKNWKQLLTVAILAFVVPVFLIIAVVQIITGGMKTGSGDPEMREEAIASRIKPVGDVNLVAAPANVGNRTGQEIYQAVCSACHAAGLMNAPKPGDKAAWQARIAQGEKTLVAHALNGIRAMPAKGGNPSLPDVEVTRAAIYMANQSGASFKEPAAPAAAAPAAPAAAAPAAAATAAATPSPGPAAAAPATGSKALTGAQVYQQVCTVCHGAGLAGAPKSGDAAAWKPRIAQGKATLYQHAINGIRAMPAKGGNASLSDADVKAAVDYLIAQVK